MSRMFFAELHSYFENGLRMVGIEYPTIPLLPPPLLPLQQISIPSILNLRRVVFDAAEHEFSIRSEMTNHGTLNFKPSRIIPSCPIVPSQATGLPNADTFFCFAVHEAQRIRIRLTRRFIKNLWQLLLMIYCYLDWLFGHFCSDALSTGSR